MGRLSCMLLAALVLSLSVLASAPEAAAAQGRGGRGDAAAPAGVSLSVEVATEIREFYGSGPESGAEALPPGIRKNLARGKPLPPGIAKRVAPAELRARIDLADGYELV